MMFHWSHWFIMKQFILLVLDLVLIILQGIYIYI